MTPRVEECLKVIAILAEGGKEPLSSEVAAELGQAHIIHLVDVLVSEGLVERTGRGPTSRLRLLASPVQTITVPAPRDALQPSVAPRLLMPITTWSGERPASPDEHAMPAGAWDGEKLGRGEVCGDCFRFRICRDLLGRKKNDTFCNWSPSRWRDAVE